MATSVDMDQPLLTTIPLLFFSYYLSTVIYSNLLNESIQEPLRLTVESVLGW